MSEKVLRDALEDAIELCWALTDPDSIAGLDDYDKVCTKIEQLQKTLAEAGEPEMKQLMRWLLREAIDAECDSAQDERCCCGE